MTMSAPSTESLVRLLFAVGGVVTGVASTVAGSWISSKIHVYHESRKAHLDEIKQKVLVSFSEVLIRQYAGLVTHKSFVVVEKWGTRRRKEAASVTEHQTEEGPSLLPVLPDIKECVDAALYADARRRHFLKLVLHVERFDEAWRTHANKCHAWVVRLSQDILAKSRLEPFPTATYDTAYVDHYKLGLFIYRRLFCVGQHSLFKRSLNSPPSAWVLEGFEGASAQGTEQELEALITVLNKLIAEERNTADRLLADARVLEQSLASLGAELNYAIAYRRLRNRCDLVPFF